MAKRKNGLAFALHKIGRSKKATKNLLLQHDSQSHENGKLKVSPIHLIRADKQTRSITA